ncbi:type 1 glutamine amidotransferase family protein [Kribbella sp. NPDC005582]|uniref:type 1 glutamine amidotransferase family protein n=1 Tax=Kribbella sp. NPDC005582 TaxID=3156893 RepID=UPI0033A98AC8
MTENSATPVHVAVYDTYADWEPGFATAHINSPNWQRKPGRYVVRTVGVSLDPIRTSGGLRVLPDITLDELSPRESAMLILPGNDLFPTPAYEPFVAKAREFLASDVPVAAICGATGGLALAGLLDDRAHTSNALEFLQSLGYGGSAYYRDELAVTDGPLITGKAQAPVEFAREILAKLEVYEPAVLDSWYKLFGVKNPEGFYELMSV